MTGTIEGRDRFLANLESRAEFAPEYRPYQPIVDLPHTRLADKNLAELIEIAEAQAAVVNANLIPTTRAALNDVVAAEIAKAGGGQVIVPTDDRFAQFNLHIAGDPLTYWRPGRAHREENIDAAQGSNAVVAFADWFLAESCTAVVYTRAGQGRSLHFLPQHYISIVPASVLVPRSTWAADQLDGSPIAAQGRAVTFISGPSNSGDIEMELVVGLHGPLAITYLIVTDA